MAATTKNDGAARRGAALLALTFGGLLCLTGAARLWAVWQAEPARIGLEALKRGALPMKPRLCCLKSPTRWQHRDGWGRLSFPGRLAIAAAVSKPDTPARG
ncbi:hypothetical protein VZ95_08085 [Elstera litoralis]|uniref:Uncharacterized protein n=1 Tax=Elstera litoralis TaxID=552518 RepID=A0A0F3ITT0_9PROT|nr:hypothetical protein [Elstera litoralis]KJV09968.1 hypothetical protein VZ95_08085 [Elstera litoralis]